MKAKFKGTGDEIVVQLVEPRDGKPTLYFTYVEIKLDSNRLKYNHAIRQECTEPTMYGNTYWVNIRGSAWHPITPSWDEIYTILAVEQELLDE